MGGGLGSKSIINGRDIPLECGFIYQNSYSTEKKQRKLCN